MSVPRHRPIVKRGPPGKRGQGKGWVLAMLPGPSGPAARGSGPAQARAFALTPFAWSEGLTTGRCRGTDTSPGQVLSEMPCCARHSASKQELGGFSKEQRRKRAKSKGLSCQTTGVQSRLFQHLMLQILTWTVAYCGRMWDNKYAVDPDRSEAPPPIPQIPAGADPEQRMLQAS